MKAGEMLIIWTALVVTTAFLKVRLGSKSDNRLRLESLLEEFYKIRQMWNMARKISVCALYCVFPGIKR